MAQARLPSLEEIFADPTVITRAGLTIPQYTLILDRLKKLEAMVGDVKNVPPDPVALALKHPRYGWMDSRHLRFLSTEIAASVDDCAASIVTMPPQHGKTNTCGVWTPFWFLAKNPDAHVLYISYEKLFARRWGVKVRTLVEQYGKDYGLEIDPNQRSGDDWALTAGGGMTCVGVGGAISGRYIRLLIVDDAIKNYEEAHSEVIRQNTWDWWEGTVVQRIQPDTAVIIIGTRYHEDDYVGRALQASANGEGIAFNLIRLPALAEDDDPIGRAVGEGLWDAKGQEYYDDRKNKVSSYVWHSVYQQSPSPPGGNMVDPEWWKFFTPAELPTSFDQAIQVWDLALDAKKKSDSFHCGYVLARKGALVFVLDIFHEHCSINNVLRTMENWNRIYPFARQKVVERSLAGPALVEAFRHRIPGLLVWPPKGRQKESKESCLNAIVPDIRSGNVLLPSRPDGSRTRTVDELVEEHRQFPRGAHDDYVDALSMGVAFLLPASHAFAKSEERDLAARKPQLEPEAAHREALHALIKKIGEPTVRYLKQQQAKLDRAAIPYGRMRPQPLGGRSGRTTRRMW